MIIRWGNMRGQGYQSLPIPGLHDAREVIDNTNNVEACRWTSQFSC